MMKHYSFAVTPQSVVLQRDDGYAFLTPDILLNILISGNMTAIH